MHGKNQLVGYDSDKPHSWVIEFSTAGIDADILAMQFSTQGGKASFGVSPIYWKAEWSLTGDLNNDDDWKFIDSYYVPDMMITSTVRPWQIGAYKQIDIRLPLEMLGHDEVILWLLPSAMSRTATLDVCRIDDSGRQ